MDQCKKMLKEHGIKVPKNIKTVVDGDLDLRQKENWHYLSVNGLHVKGNILAAETELYCLPPNLTVDGYINLLCTPLKSIPKGLHVKEDLALIDTCVTCIPDDIQVGGGISLYRLRIKKIPQKPNIKKYIDLASSAVILPDKFHVQGDLDLRDAYITEIPYGLQVDGDLSNVP